MKSPKYDKSALAIDLTSFLVIVLVAILLGMPNKLDLGAWTKELPHVIGIVNSVTALLPVLGLIFVKTQKIALHRLCMACPEKLRVFINKQNEHSF